MVDIGDGVWWKQLADVYRSQKEKVRYLSLQHEPAAYITAFRF